MIRAVTGLNTSTAEHDGRVSQEILPSSQTPSLTEAPKLLPPGGGGQRLPEEPPPPDAFT